MSMQSYTGRFAPSPTGPIHLGTLVAAMASFLDARIHDGHWLLRIEDIDRPREVAGAAGAIIRFLEQAGFEWNGSIVYQSQRDELYLAALEELTSLGMTYACDCSRSLTGPGIYPGYCRKLGKAANADMAIRITCDAREINFIDRIRGMQRHELQTETGDFVIRRRDGLFAYQLAVVVDDADSKVTDVVRGADLLDSTPRQIYLQQLLGLPKPLYAHTPLIIASDGKKLSKSLPDGKILTPDRETLVQAWNLLQPETVEAADFDNLRSFWAWASAHWQTERANRDQQL
jgi:glutamyl-Q tRNA(Asp) synthetase